MQRGASVVEGNMFKASPVCQHADIAQVITMHFRTTIVDDPESEEELCDAGHQLNPMR